jgi:hypothetical protein
MATHCPAISCLATPCLATPCPPCLEPVCKGKLAAAGIKKTLNSDFFISLLIY